MTELEEFVRAHGEAYRAIIADALRWLEENEPKWHLRQPINHEKFIANLVRSVRPPMKAKHD